MKNKKNEILPQAFSAVEDEKPQRLITLLAKRPSLCQAQIQNDPDFLDGKTLLMHAVDYDSKECFEVLLPRSNVRAQSVDGMNALLFALKLNHSTMIEPLLPKSDWQARTLKGETALMLAAQTGRVELVIRLLAHSDDPMPEDDRVVAFKGAIERAQRLSFVQGRDSDWPCADLLSEVLPELAAREWLKRVGAHRLPRLAARLERVALQQVVQQESRASSATVDPNPMSALQMPHKRRL